MSISKELRSMGESYACSTAPRALIQTIPIIGGALDTLMAGKGTQIQQDRFYALVDALARRLDELEESREIEPSEELFDLLRVAVENSVRTRSETKRERFANIIANKVVSDENSWDDAETAMRLLAELDELHIFTLIHSREEYEGALGIYDSKRVSTEDIRFIQKNLNDSLGRPTDPNALYSDASVVYLQELAPHSSTETHHIICSELKMYGLLQHTLSDVGEPAIENPREFKITAQGKWLLDWISASNAPES